MVAVAVAAAASGVLAVEAAASAADVEGPAVAPDGCCLKTPPANAASPASNELVETPGGENPPVRCY